jgi:DNA replication protein DnaC
MTTSKPKKKLGPYVPPKFITDSQRFVNIKNRLDNRKLLINDNQQVDCSDCGGSGFIKTPSAIIGGHLVDGNLEPCQNQIHSKERLERLRRKLSGTGLSKNDMSLSIRQLKPYDSDEQVKYNDYAGEIIIRKSNLEMLGYYKSIVKSPTSEPLIYLLGLYGVGKSHWGKCLVKHVNKSGKMACKYTTLHDMLADVKGGYSDNTSEQIFNNWIKTQFLVVDEFDFSEGKVKQSEDNALWLHRFLSKRIDNSPSVVTILIGNYPIENAGLENINSRMKEFKRVYNIAQDMRGKH